jgi:hypothetical protein
MNDTAEKNIMTAANTLDGATACPPWPDAHAVAVISASGLIVSSGV